MKRACLVLALAAIILASLAFFPGCGGREKRSEEEEVVEYVITSILLPKEADSDFIVEWRRKSTGIGDVDPGELAQRFWKCEGGALSEITAEEYKGLAEARVDGNAAKWAYSQHAVTVLELEKGEAVVEVGSLYGPLAGSGVQYLLRKGDEGWEKVSEETVWVT
jgi:hypothetical protein